MKWIYSEDKVYYVYIWYRLDKNEPFYVGKGKDNRDKSLKHRNKHFIDLYNYLIKNDIGYKVERLMDNLSEEEAFKLEKDTIFKLRNEGYNLVNIMDGGTGGDYVSKLSLEEKLIYCKKMSESCKGKNLGHRHTNEAKRKMSEAASKRVGPLNPFYGKRHTNTDTWKKGNHKGFKQTEEQKKAASEANKIKFCIVYSNGIKEIFNSRKEVIFSLSKKYDFDDNIFRRFLSGGVKYNLGNGVYIVGIYRLTNKKGEQILNLDDINIDISNLKEYHRNKKVSQYE